MKIPLNGRIAIVDDKINEVQPLINYFLKNRIPFNYYDAQDTNLLPSDPNKNPITLLFLDLNLDDLQTNPKNVISKQAKIIEKLCPKNPKPYLIIVWSKNKSLYDGFVENFSEDEEWKCRRPIKFVMFDKTEYFDLNGDTYFLDDGKSKALMEKLNQELDEYSTMRVLFNWENIVHESATVTIDEFLSLFNEKENFELKMKSTLFRLAKAVIGKDKIDSLEDKIKLKAAFSNFNTFLSEKIRVAVEEEKLGDLSDIDESQSGTKNNSSDADDEKLSAQLNCKLHINFGDFHSNNFTQGNVYKLEHSEDEVTKFLLDETNAKIERTKIIESKPILLKIDITPACDYAQKKNYVRLISGLLVEIGFLKYFKTNTYYQVVSPKFYIEEKIMFFLFDLRFIETETESSILAKNLKPWLKLQKEYCTELLAKLANQINRPGISSL